jgi:hypothetical protein
VWFKRLARAGVITLKQDNKKATAIVFHDRKPKKRAARPGKL